jgi:hypothetical protein
MIVFCQLKELTMTKTATCQFQFLHTIHEMDLAY